MGQFSWMTDDTNKQIGSMDENNITVYMHDNKGNVWKENNYDGYGVFGGKDYYELVAEMNGYNKDNYMKYYKKGEKPMYDELRIVGIDIEAEYDNGERKYKFPRLVQREMREGDFAYQKFDTPPERDPNQGWYQPESEECADCSGSGEIESQCDVCMGTGTIDGDEDEGGFTTSEECYECGGSGEVFESCYYCDGAGEITPGGYAKGGKITTAQEYHEARNKEYGRRIDKGIIQKDTDENFMNFDDEYFNELVNKGIIDPDNYYAKGGKTTKWFKGEKDKMFLTFSTQAFNEKGDEIEYSEWWNEEKADYIDHPHELFVDEILKLFKENNIDINNNEDFDIEKGNGHEYFNESLDAYIFIFSTKNIKNKKEFNKKLNNIIKKYPRIKTHLGSKWNYMWLYENFAKGGKLKGFIKVSELKEYLLKDDANKNESYKTLNGDKYVKESSLRTYMKNDEDYAKGGTTDDREYVLNYTVYVHKDSYEEGSGDEVHSWDSGDMGDSDKLFTSKPDLMKFIKEVIERDTYEDKVEYEDFDIHPNEDGETTLDYYVLCKYIDLDRGYDHYEKADKKSVELWKKGKKELFSVMFIFRVNTYEARKEANFAKGGMPDTMDTTPNKVGKVKFSIAKGEDFDIEVPEGKYRLFRDKPFNLPTKVMELYNKKTGYNRGNEKISVNDSDIVKKYQKEIQEFYNKDMSRFAKGGKTNYEGGEITGFYNEYGSAYQDEVEDAVRDLTSEQYEAFCYAYNVDPNNANEMSDFIADLNQEEAADIMTHIRTTGELEDRMKGMGYAKGGHIMSDYTDIPMDYDISEDGDNDLSGHEFHLFDTQTGETDYDIKSEDDLQDKVREGKGRYQGKQVWYYEIDGELYRKEEDIEGSFYAKGGKIITKSKWEKGTQKDRENALKKTSFSSKYAQFDEWEEVPTSVRNYLTKGYLISDTGEKYGWYGKKYAKGGKTIGRGEEFTVKCSADGNKYMSPSEIEDISKELIDQYEQGYGWVAPEKLRSDISVLYKLDIPEDSSMFKDIVKDLEKSGIEVRDRDWEKVKVEHSDGQTFAWVNKVDVMKLVEKGIIQPSMIGEKDEEPDYMYYGDVDSHGWERFEKELGYLPMSENYAKGGNIEDYSYDYADIGQFSMDREEWSDFTDKQFEKIGKDIVEVDYDGNIEKAYESVVRQKFEGSYAKGGKTDEKICLYKHDLEDDLGTYDDIEDIENDLCYTYKPYNVKDVDKESTYDWRKLRNIIDGNWLRYGVSNANHLIKRGNFFQSDNDEFEDEGMWTYYHKTDGNLYLIRTEGFDYPRYVVRITNIPKYLQFTKGYAKGGYTKGGYGLTRRGKVLSEDELWDMIESYNWDEDGDYKRIGKKVKKLSKNQYLQLLGFATAKYRLLDDKYSKGIQGYVSDDGWSDVRAEVVGRGKDYYNNITIKELQDMSYGDYKENFLYSFHDHKSYDDWTLLDTPIGRYYLMNYVEIWY